MDKAGINEKKQSIWKNKIKKIKYKIVEIESRVGKIGGIGWQLLFRFSLELKSNFNDRISGT